MLDAAVQALVIVLQPRHLAYLLVGVGVGLAVGVLPGLGGIVGMALPLPLIFTKDATAGLAMLIGVAAVITTSDTFVSVLMGVPGSAGSQATVVDGHAMAQKGEGARALSAASLASMIGVLSGNAPLKGILGAALGLFLGTWAPPTSRRNTATPSRWTICSMAFPSWSSPSVFMRSRSFWTFCRAADRLPARGFPSDRAGARAPATSVGTGRLSCAIPWSGLGSGSCPVSAPRSSTGSTTASWCARRATSRDSTPAMCGV